MNSVADFKRVLKQNPLLEVQHHLDKAIRNEKQEIIGYTPRPPELRTVEKIQSNSVCFKTPKGTSSWLKYPKATLCEFEGNDTIHIYEENDRENVCNGIPKVKVLTYKILELNHKG